MTRQTLSELIAILWVMKKVEKEEEEGRTKKEVEEDEPYKTLFWTLRSPCA